MEEERRRRIVELLTSCPGASTIAVAEALELDASTASYHLRRLQKAGVVTCEPNGREHAWFRAGHGFCPMLRRAIPLLRRADIVAVARELTNAGKTATMLGRETGISVGAARWAADTLVAAGLAQRSGMGRVSLAPGADVCLGKAAREECCGLWGTCPVSRRLLAEREATSR